MFIGHYGVSLGSKPIRPRLSLGILFLGVQFLDVLFALFVLAGVSPAAAEWIDRKRVGKNDPKPSWVTTAQRMNP